MSRVRVELNSFGPGVSYLFPGDRSGVPLRFPTYRLRATLAVVPRDYDSGSPFEHPGVVWPRAVLDTGAPLSVFPHPVWSRFAGRVRWLDQPPGPGRRLAILGGTFSYRLGRVKVGLADREGRWLPAVTLVGLFLEDTPGGPRETVLGLRSRLLDARQLRHEPAPGADPDDAPGRWWLEDAAPAGGR